MVNGSENMVFKLVEILYTGTLMVYWFVNCYEIMYFLLVF